MVNVTEQPGPRACSIAASLAVIGEKWSLLVVRELSLGVHRFDAIQRNTGAPRDILTSRLRRLESEGVVEKRLYQLHPPRYEYRLTEAGDELRPILLSLAEWGARWTDESTPRRATKARYHLGNSDFPLTPSTRLLPPYTRDF